MSQYAAGSQRCEFSDRLTSSPLFLSVTTACQHCSRAGPMGEHRTNLGMLVFHAQSDEIRAVKVVVARTTSTP